MAAVVMADDLTGLDCPPVDSLDPVRVEVLASADQPTTAQQPTAQGEAFDLEALRRTIAGAEQRLRGLTELRRRFEQSEQVVAELTKERDALKEELSLTRQQLIAVTELQRQLQTLLEQA